MKIRGLVTIVSADTIHVGDQIIVGESTATIVGNGFECTLRSSGTLTVGQTVTITIAEDDA